LKESNSKKGGSKFKVGENVTIRKYEKALAASIGVFTITFFIFTGMGYGRTFAFLYGLVPAICSFALLIAKKITPLRRAIYPI